MLPNAFGAVLGCLGVRARARDSELYGNGFRHGARNRHETMHRFAWLERNGSEHQQQSLVLAAQCCLEQRPPDFHYKLK